MYHTLKSKKKYFKNTSTQQHLGEDIFKLDNADDDKEREDLNMESVNFEDRWFKWNQ